MNKSSDYKVILECRYSGIPGSDWYAWVGFQSDENGFSITTGGEFLEVDDLKIVTVKNEPYTWRSAAQILLDMGLEGSIPSIALDCVVVHGETGWRSDLLALCWTREEEGEGDDLCRDLKLFLISLDDITLEILSKDLGSLISKKSLELIRQYIELDNRCPVLYWNLLFPTNSCFAFVKLIAEIEKRRDQKLEESMSERESLLAPFEFKLGAIFSKFKEDHNQPSSISGRRIYHDKLEVIKMRIEDFTINHLRLPDEIELFEIAKEVGL